MLYPITNLPLVILSSIDFYHKIYVTENRIQNHLDIEVFMTERNTTQLNDQLIDLEAQLAHQTRTIDDLSDSLSKQWDLVEKLERKLSVLTERFLALEQSTGEAPENTKPPHW